MLRRLAPLTLALGVTVGCDTAVSPCGAAPPDATANGVAVLGTGSGPTFIPLDGQRAELVLGAQGGLMITPTLRIPGAARSSGQASCAWISLQAQVGGGALVSAEPTAMELRRADDDLESELQWLLGFEVAELEGHEVSLVAHAIGEPFAVEARARVTLLRPP